MYKLLILLFFLISLNVNSGELKIVQYKDSFCYDGDTCYAILDDVPEGLEYVRVRIRGIDTPEIKGKCKAERELAQKAKSYINKSIREAHVITLRNLEWGKYGGRIVADLYIDNTNYLRYIENEKFYVLYNGGKKVKDWCK